VESADRLKRWQLITSGTLLIGYAGYYFCRSNLPLAAPFLLEEYAASGFDKAKLGQIATIGTGFYFAGKLMGGVLGDYFGGRRIFLVGMLASIVCTVFFGMGTGFTVFASTWALNRLAQSLGWGALVKIASRWFPFRIYGTVMAVLSLSFLFGDALARLVLGELLEAGIGWRRMFFASAGVLLAVAAVTSLLLHDSPLALGLSEPEASPSNVFGDTAEARRPSSLWALIGPFVRNPSFWIVAVLSFGLTLIREVFGLWTPVYLAEVGGLSKAGAGIVSLYFPLFGGFSVIAAGLVTDRLLGGRRGGYIALSLVALTVALFVMSAAGKEASGSWLPQMFVSLVALLMGGPYSFLAGAISLDLGGKSGSATAAGLIDGAGYFGGMLSGWAFGALVEQTGWSGGFALLACTALITTGAAVFYWRRGA
jgi:OPA family glycerol-3-phosphate transporter-like MFS transporter